MKWPTIDHKRVNDCKHNRQCTYNVILRGISVTIIAEEKQ